MIWWGRSVWCVTCRKRLVMFDRLEQSQQRDKRNQHIRDDYRKDSMKQSFINWYRPEVSSTVVIESCATSVLYLLYHRKSYIQMWYSIVAFVVASISWDPWKYSVYSSEEKVTNIKRHYVQTSKASYTIAIRISTSHLRVYLFSMNS